MEGVAVIKKLEVEKLKKEGGKKRRTEVTDGAVMSEKTVSIMGNQWI